MSRPDSFREVEHITGADPVPLLSCSDVLRQRDRPVSLFTAALLFTHGGFDRDPVIEFDARYPAESADLRPFGIDLRRDHEFFFRGLGIQPPPGRQTPVNWDKRLYAIDSSREEECFGFLGGISFSHPKTGFFGNSFSYNILIPDPTSSTGDILSVRVFGVYSNVFIAMLLEQFNKPAIARRVTTPANGMLPDLLRGSNVITGYTGEDPLNMRDQ